jgi:hypothetical protein
LQSIKHIEKAKKKKSQEIPRSLGSVVWSYVPVMSMIARTVVDRQKFVIGIEEEIVEGSQVVYV